VITLSPHDVLMIARAAGISTREAIARFTLRRGSIQRFGNDGACVALEGARCGLHRGRPLACRLYPLGIERDVDGIGERFVQLEPASGSAGIYGTGGTVADFLEGQGVAECLAMNDHYRPLIATFRDRIAALADFEKTEPREFWRRATREALAESGYDPNPLIDAMFDADRFALSNQGIDDVVAAHVGALAALACESHDPDALAAAVVLLAVSLGYSPSVVMES